VALPAAGRLIGLPSVTPACACVPVPDSGTRASAFSPAVHVHEHLVFAEVLLEPVEQAPGVAGTVVATVADE